MAESLGLLYILNLLLNPVYSAFYIDHIADNRCIGGFAGNSVGLSEHLLADEVQPASRLVVSLTALNKLLHM